MAHTGSDKIQITVNPPLPTTCSVCKRPADGIVRFFDFNENIDYYGAVLICEDDVKTMITLLDYVKVAERDAILQELEITQGELSVVRQENDRLRNAFDAIVSVRPDLDGVLASDSSDELDSELEGSLDSGAGEDKGFDGSPASRGSEILFGSGSTD